MALGHVVLHEPRIVVTRLIAEDIELERRRLAQAIEDLTGSIDSMLERGDMARAGEHREVLEAFRMFAHDHGWRRRLDEALLTGLTAEAAVQRVRNDTRARMLRMPDPHARDRLHDIDDLSNRLLRLLSGGVGTAATGSLPQDAIVVARTMGPAELLDYDRQRLRGLVLEEGGAASHVAIVARALGIAAITQVKGVLEAVEPGDAAIVDAEGGELHVRPTQEVVSAYADKVRFRARRQAQYAALRTVPSVTLDGERVALHINAGLLFDLPHLDQSGADGIGLFRTELQFMIAATFPRLEQQTRLYKAILDAAGDRPVVFRSLDVGGDKVLPYFRVSHGGEPGHRLARHPHGARPAGFVPHPDQGAAQGGGRPRASRHAADDRRRVGVHRGACADRPRGDAAQAVRPARAEDADGRRHDRGAGAAVAARPLAALGRFRFGRLERFDAVPVCRRPRQYRAWPSVSMRSIRPRSKR